ncbi:adaptor protein MecA [Streptococcus suis]|nr:adaptor protein MecA [Streptococcus suis]HEL9644976.1 adaptor protein MecA [Streptococcus suis]
MKMKQISDSTLKITIKLEDLEERGMEIADFLIPQEKTEEFFYTVLDELDLPHHFRESGMLSFRVTPKPDKIDIFVTKSDIDKNIDFNDFAELADLDEISQMSPDEFLKTLEQSVREKSVGDKEAVQHLEKVENLEEEGDRHPYIYYILVFKHLNEIVEFVRTLNFSIEESELYKMDGQYYLTVLINIEHQTDRYPDYVLARMLEYTEDTTLTRSFLLEHGYLLLPAGAIEALGKVELL